jgi:hypothetical protein
MLTNLQEAIEKLGYSIVTKSKNEIVAVRNKWYWDCIATNLTLVVFINNVSELDNIIIEKDTQRMITIAKKVDPSKIPMGFQKGRAVIPIYIAEKVSRDAIKIINSSQSMRYGTIIFPGVLDLSTNNAYYLRDTPLWGGLYIPKLRYLVQHIIDLTNAEETEPISLIGYASTIAMAIIFVYAISVLLFG